MLFRTTKTDRRGRVRSSSYPPVSSGDRSNRPKSSSSTRQLVRSTHGDINQPQTRQKQDRWENQGVQEAKDVLCAPCVAAWHVVVVCKMPQRRITFISRCTPTAGQFTPLMHCQRECHCMLLCVGWFSASQHCRG